MKLMTLKEAAIHYSVSESTLYRLARSGDPIARKIGNQWRFSANEPLNVPVAIDSKRSFDTQRQMKFIDLFCGIGGFHQSAIKHDMECVFASDIDKYAQETYRSWYGVQPEGDLTKFTSSEEALDKIPCFDVLFAGFPCQPFSYAGLGEGFEDETRGTLFFHVAKIIAHHKPKMFLLENVKGLKSHQKGKTLEVIKQTLRELGYTLYDDVLNSYDFGVPQYRERWFCAGFRNDLAVSDFSFSKGELRGSVLNDILEREPTNFQAIPEAELERIKFHFSNQHLYADGRVEHDNSKYKPDTKKGKHGVYSFLKPDRTLRFHIGDRAKTQIQEAYYVHKDTFAPAIIANRRPKLWDLKRFLTVKECMALQAFPLNLEFPVSNAQTFKQLGNSVCVNVIDSIVEDMMQAVDK
ncbi:DNA (cytosine-5-)-methyltransferase [Vibrio sp. 10N.286.45.F3]|uniref:DNA (cytosine-5-)-methyltransferase n=2 Tax=unclassified Vibrio TaxID=2614977 RepID=UPI000C837489|nr:DNA (cytosine-5-)-methyltransferase [Vibrio sp. 10N.261.45.A1]